MLSTRVTRRLTKQQAALARGVSPATIDRLTADVSDGITPVNSHITPDMNDATAVAVLQERLAAWNREIEGYKERLANSEWGYHELLQRVPVALPSAPSRSLLTRLLERLPMGRRPTSRPR